MSADRLAAVIYDAYEDGFSSSAMSTWAGLLGRIAACNPTDSEGIALLTATRDDFLRIADAVIAAGLATAEVTRG